MSTKYNKEFKEEIVKMYLSGIRPVDIVKNKNIKRLNIYDWVQAYKNSTLDTHGNNRLVVTQDETEQPLVFEFRKETCDEVVAFDISMVVWTVNPAE